MYCYKHENEATVGICACGRGLCKPCSERFEPMGCDKCAVNSVRLLRRDIYKDFSITAALFGVGFLVVESGGGLHLRGASGIWPALVIGYLYAGIRAGWITIGRISSPSSTLAVPIILWVFLQFLKLIGAAFIGVFALPVRLVQQAASLMRTAAFERTLRSPLHSGPRLVYSTK